jgi:hypothetical protein
MCYAQSASAASSVPLLVLPAVTQGLAEVLRYPDEDIVWVHKSMTACPTQVRASLPSPRCSLCNLRMRTGLTSGVRWSARCAAARHA